MFFSWSDRSLRSASAWLCDRAARLSRSTAAYFEPIGDYYGFAQASTTHTQCSLRACWWVHVVSYTLVTGAHSLCMFTLANEWAVHRWFYLFTIRLFFFISSLIFSPYYKVLVCRNGTPTTRWPSTRSTGTSLYWSIWTPWTPTAVAPRSGSTNSSGVTWWV